MYAKETQTDAVSVKDKASDEEEEEEESTQATQQDLQSSGFKGSHKDDTIEPEKQVNPLIPRELPDFKL